MKTSQFIGFLGLFFASFGVFSTPRGVWAKDINWYKPIVKESGPLRDSISASNSNKSVYISHGQYYIINSLGDYYLWFIDRYPGLFNASNGEYQYYYLNQDNYRMSLFVSQYYTGKHLPVPFKETFEKKRRSLDY